MRRRATRSFFADSVVRSSPLTTTEPEVGGVSRLMHCASVLLPAPLGPTTARISPASTRKLMSSSTTVRWRRGRSLGEVSQFDHVDVTIAERVAVEQLSDQREARAVEPGWARLVC